MEDPKLRSECWVVLVDCRRFLKGTLEDSEDISTGETQCDDSEEDSSITPCSRKGEEHVDSLWEDPKVSVIDVPSHSPCIPPNGLKRSGTADSTDNVACKRFGATRKRHSSLKKAHKIEDVLEKTSASRSTLLQKYGQSLLRKPAFLVSSDNASGTHSHPVEFSEERDGASFVKKHVAPEVLTVTLKPFNIDNVKSHKKQKYDMLLNVSSHDVKNPQSDSGVKRLMETDNGKGPKEDSVSPQWLSSKLIKVRKDLSFKSICDSRKEEICDSEKISRSETSPENGWHSVCDQNPIFDESDLKSTILNESKVLSQPNADDITLGEVILGDDNQLFTNPSYPMPSVGIAVSVGAGHPLDPLQGRCVLTCLDECRNLISPEYAAFCSSAVRTSSKLQTKLMIVPIKNEQITQLMEIKWRARSAVGKVPKVNFNIMRGSCAMRQNVPNVQNGPIKSNQVKNDVCKKRRQRHFKTSNATMTGQQGVNQSISHNAVCNDNKIHFTDYSESKKDSCTTVLTVSSDLNKEFLESDAQLKNTPPISNQRPKFTLLAAVREKLISNDTPTCVKPSNEGFNSVASSKVSIVKNTTPQNEFLLGKKLTITQRSSLVDVPEPKYDPDDTRGVEGSDEVIQNPTTTCRSKSSHLMHELRRLNVALFDMTHQEPVHCKTPDTCRLGCVCNSLTAIIVRDHCGLEKCMFGCVCPKPQFLRRENKNESFTWIQNKAKANLAKEERHFKQTVVRSGKDDLIVVEGRRKRQIKVPGRYRDDFITSVGDQLARELSTKKSAKSVSQAKETFSKDISRHVKSAGDGGIADTCTYGKSTEKNLNILKPIKANSNDLLGISSSFELSTNLESTEGDDDSSISPDKEYHGTSARTAGWSPRSKKNWKEKQKKLQCELSCKEVDASCELKIKCSKSLSTDDWKRAEKNSVNFVSCVTMFDEPKENEVVLINWEVLRRDFQTRLVFLWIKSLKQIPKIYLTNKNKQPCEGVKELQSIPISSEEFQALPLNLRSLRVGHVPECIEERCSWIAKYQKGHWRLVGFMQTGQQNEKTVHVSEVDILSSRDYANQHRWWLMDVNQNFDLIFFMDFKKALTKQQITTLLKLSNEYSEGENKVHRILLNRSRPGIDPSPSPCPDFGAYSLPNRPSEVLIGPYDSTEEPRLQVFSQKVAHNGKSEYESIPVFCLGNGECVRINSKRALSLDLEDLPDIHIKGSWYQSCDSLIRKAEKSVASRGSSKQIRNSLKSHQVEYVDLTNQSISEDSSSNHFIGDSVESEDEVSEVLPKADQRRDVTNNKNLELKSTYSKDVEANVSSWLSAQLEDSSSSESDFGSTSGAQAHPKSPTEVLPVIEMDSDQTSIDEGDTINGEQAEEIVMEYLVPSVKEIGVLPVTCLPNGTLSLPHFTEPGLLKFFRNKGDVLKEINCLIHEKLACLSRKCSVVLKPNTLCKCVTWRSVSNGKKCANLPKFSPKIFDGFHMLTSYGLLNICTADEAIIKKLGQDWIEWVKNDEFRQKLLFQFKVEENQEITREHHHLMNILTLNQTSDLSLQEVLKMATDEIVRLKAQDELLNYESQAQTLLKETMIYSLCRKLKGFPESIVPRFLEQLNLDVLWEVLECMGSRNLPPLDAVPKEDCPPYQMTSKEPVSQHVNDHQQGLKQQLNNEMLGRQQTKDRGGLVCQVSPFSRLNFCIDKSGIKSGFSHLNFFIDESGIMNDPLKTPPRSAGTSGDKQAHPVKVPTILRRNVIHTNDLPVPTRNSILTGNQIHIHTPRKQTFSVSPGVDEEVVFQEDAELSPDEMYESSLCGIDKATENTTQICTHTPLTNGLKALLETSPATSSSAENSISSVSLEALSMHEDSPVKIQTTGTLGNGITDAMSSYSNSAQIADQDDSVSSLKITSVYSTRTMSVLNPSVRSSVTPKSTHHAKTSDDSHSGISLNRSEASSSDLVILTPNHVKTTSPSKAKKELVYVVWPPMSEGPEDDSMSETKPTSIPWIPVKKLVRTDLIGKSYFPAVDPDPSSNFNKNEESSKICSLASGSHPVPPVKFLSFHKEFFKSRAASAAVKLRKLVKQSEQSETAVDTNS